MEYLSLTVCVKNEGQYIQEWLAYYKSLGVEKFYVFNDKSVDDTEDKINDLSFRDDINLIEFDSPSPDRQGYAYQVSYKNYGKQNTEWMIYCDADEYFMPTVPTDLKVFLQDYEAYSGLGVSWRIYGSAGHILRKPGTCLDNFLYRAKDDWEPNHHVKVIVKPNEIKGYTTPHMFATTKGVVNEDGEPIDESKEGRIDIPLASKIRVNHYFNRSYEDWIEKRRRGRATIKEKRPIEMFDTYDKNDVYDDLALKYVEGVKKFLWP